MTGPVWVTGARGLLGTALVRELESRGVEVIGTDAELDVSTDDFDEILEEKPTAIFHCAVMRNVNLCERPDHRRQAKIVNTLGASNVAIAAQSIGARLVYFSTDYVFDGRSHVPYKETDPVGPINHYGVTKLAGEVEVATRCPSALIIRTSWLFGEHGACFPERIIERLGNKSQWIEVVADQIGRPTYTKDLAHAALDLAELAPAPGLYHFANAGETSWYAMALAIKSEAIRNGMPVGVSKIIPVAAKTYEAGNALRPAYSVLDTSKIERALGRQPRSWEAALSDYFRRRF